MRTAGDLNVCRCERGTGIVAGALVILSVALALTSCTTDRTRRGYLRDMARELAPPPRPVIVVPGFGVTRLFDPVAGSYVWGTARATVRLRFEDDLDLPISEEGTIGRDRLLPRGYVGSRGPINVGWQITEALRKYGRYELGQDAYPFYYDWRLSARDNAAALGELVDKVRREQIASQVDIVTHSAGAVVALAYVKLAGGGPKVKNLILIAPTRRGVIDAFRVLVRPERFIRRVFATDVVATWPSVPELLPDDGHFLVDETGRALDFNAWDADSWKLVPVGPSRLEGPARTAFADSLRQARRFRDQLSNTPLPASVTMTIIAGDCAPTARRALMRSDGTFAFYPDELRPAETSLSAHLFEAGDGTVPISSAQGNGQALVFCDGHQGLATDPSVHRAMLRILQGSR